mgnify:CR=1 FL=1
MKKLALLPLLGHHQYTLANGLRIIHQPSFSDVAYCGFAVDAGTRDELENEQGMAHFVEHLIFKGTQKRKAWHILNRMENVGGDLNAYTNKEETVIYSAFLTEHFGRAFELLADIVFHSTFPQREIEKETEVIIDEIQSYEDTPSELIFDDFEDLIFRGHPLGRNILGNPELLKTFHSEDAAAFTSRFYHPGNMVFFVWGNLYFKQIIRLAEKLLADVPAVTVDNRRTPPSLYTPEKLVVHKDTHQAHVMIGSRGYNAYDDKRTALYLLQFNLIPHTCTGKKTRCYAIKKSDVIAFMNDREVNPEKYIAPKNWYKYGSEMVRPYKIRIHPPCAKDEKKLRRYYESKLAALPDVMDVAAAVDFTGYNRRTVCQWIRVGKLKALALLQKYMIPKCYLIDWLCSDDYNNTNRKSRRHIDMLWEVQKWNDMR